MTIDEERKAANVLIARFPQAAWLRSGSLAILLSPDDQIAISRALAAESALATMADAFESALLMLRTEGWDGHPVLEQGEKVLEGYREAAAIRAQEQP